jgi:hypothetical protein
MPALSSRRLRLIAALIVTAVPTSPGAWIDRAEAQEVAGLLPSPESILGFQPGEARRLAGWGTISGYLDALGEASERIRVDTIGRSTLDRPMQLLTITSPGNMVRLDALKAIQEKLADPRQIQGEQERAELIRDGRLIVLVTAALHSNEVGSSLLPIRLAYQLAASDSPEVQSILDESVVLIVPSLNPDGVDLVAEWYESTLDMPWEGAEPPFLYHHYAGHDNNRDWSAFALQETRVVVERVHEEWHPQIVHDVHQQRVLGSRYFVPPWLGPVEPNVDPALIAGANALGTAIAWSMTLSGRPGVLVAGDFDAWSPARAYPHYHAGVRILSETASARLASPVDLSFERLRPGRGYDPRKASWNQPWPWPGGRWDLASILDYMESGALALLQIASRDRAAWLESFVAIGERAVAGGSGRPRMWAIPPVPEDPGAAVALVDALRSGGVEVGVARDGFQLSGRSFPAGTFVVDSRQPYASFASVLLDPQPYPPTFDDRGHPVAPYDGTAHTLALLFGVDVLHLDEVPSTAIFPVLESASPPVQAPGLTDDPGTLVGLYRSHVPSSDEGWTRWWLDRASIPYVVLRDSDIRAGDLIRLCTAVILPSASEETLLNGWQAGEQSPLISGGLGAPGVAALREFVAQGGTLVALNRASRFAIRQLELPIDDAVAELPDEELLAAGAILALDVDTAHAVGRGMPTRTSAWVDGGSDFRPHTGSGARVVARFPTSPNVLSGWVHGESRLAGAGAIAEVPLGGGRVVLFGFQPQFRGQARATVPLLFNSLRRPVGSSNRPAASPGP